MDMNMDIVMGDEEATILKKLKQVRNMTIN